MTKNIENTESFGNTEYNRLIFAATKFYGSFLLCPDKSDRSREEFLNCINELKAPIDLRFCYLLAEHRSYEAAKEFGQGTKANNPSRLILEFKEAFIKEIEKKLTEYFTPTDAAFKSNSPDVTQTTNCKIYYSGAPESPYSATRYPSAYYTIAASCHKQDPLEVAKRLLLDYTENDSAVRRFFRGHWNRHHTAEVAKITPQIGRSITNLPDLIDLLKCIQPDNLNGSLARRITFMEQELLGRRPESQLVDQVSPSFGR